ncbi:FAD-dependent oxidoreductase [Gammaproteobacteria bacterium]|nr:FAD-dependent oxidoreductase [Gammaproteobacteria bacterium]
MATIYSTDIIIFGGGITGLWLLNRLRREGYNPILFETKSVGGKQTIAAQGIIHGGLKYALAGKITDAANAVAAMPLRWRRCLGGTGEVDLTGVKVLSEHYYMWSDAGLRSKIKSFLGSKTLVGKVKALKKTEYPEFFKSATVDGNLYKLPDFVIDTESLIKKLAADCRERIFSLDMNDTTFLYDRVTGKHSLQIVMKSKTVTLNAEKFIFSAGEGNSQLIKMASLDSIRSQIRPLHMVYLSKNGLPEVNAHCVGDSFSLTPKLTITSHRRQNGDTVWYLGGDIAESGNQRTQNAQIIYAKKLLEKLFPWVDLHDADWNSFIINRAEGKVKGNYRPDSIVLDNQSNIFVVWPTKLTLTPSLADKVVEHCKLKQLKMLDNASNLLELKSLFQQPKLAQAKWE